jgi:DnaK suppressor protein
MPAKKPSVKPTRPKKTVSAKTTAKPAVKPAVKAKARSAPVKPASKAVATRAPAKTPPAKIAPVKTPAVKTPAAKTPAAKTPAVKAAAASAPAKPVAQVQAATTPPGPIIKTVQPPRPLEDLRSGMSLLSGPRNVEPYVPRKGEEYMSKEQLDHFRFILSSWKQDLMQEVDRTMLHMKDEASNFPDPNDRATQESEFSLELRTRDRERKLIRKIDEALKRIEDGSYGYCLETGEPIGVKRLEARPVATLSVEAQERRERREKQFGDRDDR